MWPNPIKSIIGWCWARRLPADLRDGDICFIPSDGGGYSVVKILATDETTIHVRLYKSRFSEVPRFVNAGVLSVGTIHDEHHGIGHLPLSRATFASWLPTKVQHEPVTEEELEGYRIWQESQGGVWG